MGNKPNILVICSDQHHPRMVGYRDHPIVKTPNLDRLAADGTYFTRAYCNSPICTPSRMSFITGKYTHQIGSWFIGCPLDPEESTWSRRLHQAGIPSTMLGKMDFCGDYQDGGFTDHKIIHQREAWSTYPRKVPFEPRLKGYNRPEKRRHLIRAGARSDQSDGSDVMNGQFGYYDHDRQVADWALDYIREKGMQEAREPWCLYVGLLFPHWPYIVPKRYYDMYYPSNIVFPHDAHFPNERLHPAVRHFQKALDLGEVTEDMLRRTISAYYGMITALDDMIGEIISELKRQGLYDNTHIIYTSDHGESLGEHGLFYKQCSYEGSAGVPLIVKGPGLPGGNRIDHPVTLVDMYPTILDMAGLEIEPDCSGTSWMPLIRGETHERPDYAFSEFHGNFFRQDWYMLVQGHYKYTYYVKERPSLFNLNEDPEENHDLALDAGYMPVLNQFEKLLRTIVDPEEVSLRAKSDLGLIGPNGEDYTETLSIGQWREGMAGGTFSGTKGLPG